MGSSSSQLSPSLLASAERTGRTRHGSFDDNKQGVERRRDDELFSLCDAYRFNSGGDIQKMNALAAAAAAADNKDVNTGDHVRNNITSQNTSHSSAHHETHTNHPSDDTEHCFVVKTSSVDKPNSHPSNAQKPDICSDGMGNPVSGRRSIDDAQRKVFGATRSSVKKKNRHKKEIKPTKFKNHRQFRLPPMQTRENQWEYQCPVEHSIIFCVLMLLGMKTSFQLSPSWPQAKYPMTLIIHHLLTRAHSRDWDQPHTTLKSSTIKMSIISVATNLFLTLLSHMIKQQHC
jgi:hypothetical protein